MKLSTIVLIFIFFMAMSSCKEENVLPKPKAMLRLEYERPTAKLIDTENFTFEANKLANVDQKKNAITIAYPEMKAAVFISYRKVNNDLNRLIRDAHKLSGEHATRADGIQQKIFENFEHRVYGAFYEVSGDAASQAQFFVTDSLNHFVTGALYFRTKPNYDSIYPAAKYLQNDMGRIMESLRWK